MSLQRIAQWFAEGVKNDKHWMLVVCDTFNYEDYPLYFDTEAEAQAEVNRYFDGEVNMQRLVEVYCLDHDPVAQLETPRCMQLRPQYEGV